MTPGLRIGLLVNPIAGIGGPAALKGSDADWKQALADGFEPQAGLRAARFVAGVQKAGADVDWLTCRGVMGVEGLPRMDLDLPGLGETGPEDTRRAAAALADAGVDLLCFVGGDGTATDVSHAVGTRVACLGIPGGVKITSPVFAHDIDEAAWLVAHLGSGFETVPRDVTDLDEAAYRDGRLDTRLTGSLRVPLSPFVQGGKSATTSETPLEPLVEMVLRDWDRDALHLVGAGSVCAAIKSNFWGDGTLLGIDAIRGDRIVATDCDARHIAALVAEAQGEGRAVRIVLSTIGGQGVLLGRGTQVFTPDVLRTVGWAGLSVVAPPEKLVGLPGLVVDTGDADLDASAPKYLRVVSGWNETRMVRINPPPRDPKDSS